MTSNLNKMAKASTLSFKNKRPMSFQQLSFKAKNLMLAFFASLKTRPSKQTFPSSFYSYLLPPFAFFKTTKEKLLLPFFLSGPPRANPLLPFNMAFYSPRNNLSLSKERHGPVKSQYQLVQQLSTNAGGS